MRYDEQGEINKKFILNKSDFLESKILLAYEIFVVHHASMHPGH